MKKSNTGMVEIRYSKYEKSHIFWNIGEAEHLLEDAKEGVPTIYVGDAKVYTWFTQKFGIGNDLQEYFNK